MIPSDTPSTRSAQWRIIYLSHLVVPCLIVLDELNFFVFEDVELHRPLRDELVLTFCALWLIVGLGGFLLSQDRGRFVSRLKKPLISFYAVFFVLVLFEGFARVVLRPAAPTPFLWPPGSQFVFRPDSWGVTGVSGTTRFTVNELGLRGPSLPPQADVYKIIAVGGSTTQCLVLDDSKEWPHLVMEFLNNPQNRRPTWVANAGVSGHSTVHHLELLKTIPVFKQVDMIILLIGVNDLGATLAYEGASSQAQLEKDAAAFREYLVAGARDTNSHPYYTRLRLYELVRLAKTKVRTTLGHTAVGVPQTDLELWRRRRAEGKIVPLPDLHIGLSEYHERVRRLNQECHVLGVRCLFLTQPTLWRSDLTPADERSLWSGYVGQWNVQARYKGYVGAADLAQAMNVYNETLLDACSVDGLECLDLASAIPRDSRFFYDDEHFTEAGAHLVAEKLRDYLLSKPPFGQSTSKTR
jgi:hypothetical protein